ncbi:Kelch domain-containing protein 10 [Thelohanellus kitauei]|uniref:Kelch domain-containing protein 10 n=1 Tax=Thelohanellus kitauei TaxID=669202 RepID=A0A0C2MA43_THEKT|nr:Kelch domain-containing protein 10 [Thelohanellus kitauei]
MNVTGVMSAPTCRSDHSMTSTNKFLIVYGGCYNTCETVFNEMCIYNTITDMWRLYPGPFESEKRFASSAICAVRNSVYIFGGSNPHSYNDETNLLFVFDISSATWKTLSAHTNEYDQNSPPPMYDNCILYHNESLYILGGFAGNEFSNKMFKFHLKTSLWTLVPQNGPKPRSKTRLFATVFQNKFYCFGGYLENPTDKFEHVNIFDFSTHTWTTKQTHPNNGEFPSDRNHQSFVFSSEYGYLSGGDRLCGFYNGIWRINLESLEWLKLDYSLKSGMVFHKMAIVDDSMLYVFGGWYEDSICSDKLERFALKPQPLYQLCLESIRRLPNVRSIAALLPKSIADELNANTTD